MVDMETLMRDQNKRRGFSLIELLVALVVLFAVSTIVLQTAPGQAGQKNLQSTQEKLEAIRVAVVGKTSNKKGHSVVGYLQDMGGLPKRHGSDPNYFLNHLLEMPADTSGTDFAYGLKQADWPDADIEFNVGWRGPYLQSVFPGDKIVDGWGNALNHGGGATVTSIQSNGGPDAPYDTPYPSQPIVFDVDQASSDVSGGVNYENFYLPGIVLGLLKIHTSLFEPDPNTGGIKSRKQYTEITSSSSSSPVAFDFDNVLAGSRAIRTRLYFDFEVWFFGWKILDIEEPLPGYQTTWFDVPANGVVEDADFTIDMFEVGQALIEDLAESWGY